MRCRIFPSSLALQRCGSLRPRQQRNCRRCTTTASSSRRSRPGHLAAHSRPTQGVCWEPGELRVPDSFSWGLVVSFLAHMGSAVELLYSRQDSDIEFDPAAGGTNVPLPGGFAFNYVQIGGRQEFGHSEKLRPFITGSLGINVLDPKAEGVGSSTRFSWSVGGGAKYMFSSQRIGIRSDIKLWVTPVPSGDYGVWCGFYACVAGEGTAWVNQGQWTGGLVFAF